MRRGKFVFYPHVSLLQRPPQWVHLKPTAKWLPVRTQPRSQVLSPWVGETLGTRLVRTVNEQSISPAKRP